MDIWGRLKIGKAVGTFMRGATQKEWRRRPKARAVGTEKDQRGNKNKKENGTKMNIKKNLGMTALSVALLLASGIPSFAANSRTVTLQHDAVLSGTGLSAGRYSIRWQTHSPEATVDFVRRHKVVLSTEGRVEERDKTYDRDAVVYSTHPDGTWSVIEIRFANTNKVLVFNQ